jgi:CheY-like chemotaxis protein
MKILFVDDDTDDKEIFFEAITEINPDVQCDVASNGAEALEKLQLQDVLPRYIFLDINMPIMDGKSFLIAIRGISRLKHIPVVIYSTTGEKEKIRELTSLGAEYIGKPTSFEVLKKSLAKYLIQD